MDGHAHPETAGRARWSRVGLEKLISNSDCMTLISLKVVLCICKVEQIGRLEEG